MKSEDKIINALNVLDSLCAKEKSLVNKFIVSDMSKSLRDNFKFIQTTLDSQDSHVQEQQEQIDRLEKDAARYRYLRESSHFGGMQKYRLEWYLPRRFDVKDFRVELDEAIDERLSKDNL